MNYRHILAALVCASSLAALSQSASAYQVIEHDVYNNTPPLAGTDERFVATAVCGTGPQATIVEFGIDKYIVPGQSSYNLYWAALAPGDDHNRGLAWGPANDISNPNSLAVQISSNANADLLKSFPGTPNIAAIAQDIRICARDEFLAFVQKYQTF